LKTNITINDIVSKDVLEKAYSFLNYESTRFNDQVEFLELDPLKDFRFADLSGFDFSNADLRGFDFTGADLRDTTGVNVQWNETTLLSEADTTNSLFAYQRERDEFLRDNPEAAETVRKLTKEYWTKAILGVQKVLEQGKSNPQPAIKIAKAVFDQTSDTVVKSNILYFMRLLSDTPEDHKNFIFNIFATHSHETSILISAVRALVSLYRNDLAVQKLLLRCLEHSDETIRSEALKGLLSSKHIKQIFDKVLQHVIDLNQSYLRRKLLGQIAKIAGSRYVQATTDHMIKNSIDFVEPITERRVYEIAKQSLVKEKFERISETGPRKERVYETPSLVGALDIDESIVEDRTKEFLRLLRELKSVHKIPFNFKEAKSI
jgi:hypothetical protein